METQSHAKAYSHHQKNSKCLMLEWLDGLHVHICLVEKAWS